MRLVRDGWGGVMRTALVISKSKLNGGGKVQLFLFDPSWKTSVMSKIPQKEVEIVRWPSGKKGNSVHSL